MALAAPATAGASCGGEYTVAPGDTLSRIASRCGSSVAALMLANPRITSPAQIAVGWQVSVPGGGGSVEVGSVDAKSVAVGGAEPAASGRPVALSGRIVNGRRCAMIETADGEAFGVVSPEFAFVNGALVDVIGQVIDDPSCTGPRTLLVNELTGAEST